jgi:Zn-dependent M28 family amino/carboxypeptidase
MKKYYTLLGSIFISAQLSTLTAQTDSSRIREIYTEALTHGKSYSNLDYLTNRIGGRLSGSPEAQKAVEWAFKAMKEAGADTVYLQECWVPHWVRGAKESGKIISVNVSENRELAINALGGSIGTPTTGLTAGIIEVKDIESLEKVGRANIEGKFVFFNEVMDPTKIETFDAYGDVIQQRWAGASEAVKFGAVGVIVRSCSLLKDDHPHTGSMTYADTLHKIPACVISTLGADWLSEHLKNNNALKFNLKMNCKTLPDEKSYNVIGELKGSMQPTEYIVVGGHLDSWDTGKGAHDDGAGVVQSMEVIRIYKALGLKPKRTIRAVAFMNEENGSRGGKKYAAVAKLKNEKHLAAIESDNGGFTPRGFTSTATPEIKAKIKSWRPLLEPYGVYDFNQDGTGVDIRPLIEMGTTCFELKPDSQRYFDYHHASTDTFETVNKRELELGGAAMAALVWIISENGF